MNRLLSARPLRPDTSLHPIPAGARRLAAARHEAALLMLGMSAVIFGATTLALVIILGGRL